MPKTWQCEQYNTAMAQSQLSVREIAATDIPYITQYWLNADTDYLIGMGVDPAKLPTAAQWGRMLDSQINSDYPNKKAYAIILEVDGQPIGHCNVNPVDFGEEAFMHLHIWNPADRGQGYGTELVRLAIPFFFKNLQLKRLLCQPYANNPGPNKTLPKLGFRFVETLTTIPGSINFEQAVNRWILDC